ncbi:MAG: response regulator [Nitrospiraceae bacterium]|nr:MAG: response regulator [Nitrospiraceae bacterium]
MKTEHRKQKRIPFNHGILINNLVMGNATDISEEGLYVHTGRMFSKGSVLEISVPVKSRVLSLKAEVKHCEEGVGMGMEFVNIDHFQRDQLNIILAELEAKARGTDKKKILIADANESARRMNKSRLVLDGFSVLEAKSPEEALKILQEEQIDMAILDIYMMPVDGLDLISHIRQMPQYVDIPVIAWAAKNTPEVIEQAKNAGATIFLPKATTSPIKMSENVKKLLKNS